ncbi:unnamed protein product [Ectocarpus sp. 4 AP-2014]
MSFACGLPYAGVAVVGSLSWGGGSMSDIYLRDSGGRSSVRMPLVVNDMGAFVLRGVRGRFLLLDCFCLMF